MTGEAFAQAVQTYGDTVYRVAFHALNSREDAEDVMQTVMLKLFEYDKEFESEAHLKHWLLRVSVNESRKLLRSFWRRVSVPLDDGGRNSCRHESQSIHGADLAAPGQGPAEERAG